MHARLISERGKRVFSTAVTGHLIEAMLVAEGLDVLHNNSMNDPQEVRTLMFPNRDWLEVAVGGEIRPIDCDMIYVSEERGLIWNCSTVFVC